MKAVIVRDFTDFDKAEVGELADPVPQPGEVVVDIEAAEVNFPDILYIEGRYQKLPPFPFSPGLAGAGRVSALGDGVDSALLDKMVLALPYYGTYADKVRTAAGYCFPMPAGMDAEVAASFGLVYQTAYFALTERAAIAPGDTVLVLGATGGIGMAAVQLAKALGADKVIAATRGADGAKFAQAIGADAVVDSGIDNLRDGLRDAVSELTGGHGADVVIDPVGGDLAAAALRTVAWCGRYVVVGFASGEIPKFAGNYLLVKNISISGIQWTDYRARELEKVRSAQEHIFDLWAQGRLFPHISLVLPLEQYSDALEALKAGAARGKIVLKTKSRQKQ